MISFLCMFRWLQPDSYADPQKTSLILNKDDIRCGWPTTVVVQTKDQYGDVVHVPNMKVGLPCAKKELFFTVLFKIFTFFKCFSGIFFVWSAGGGEGCACLSEKIYSTGQHEEVAAAPRKPLKLRIRHGPHLWWPASTKTGSHLWTHDHQGGSLHCYHHDEGSLLLFCLYVDK